MKKIFNRYTIVFALIVIISIVMIIIINKNNREGYILLSNAVTVKCSERKGCENISNDFLNEKELGWFDVYTSNNKNEYKPFKIDRWNFYDKNGNWTKIVDDFLASSKELNLINRDYEVRNLNNEELGIIDSTLKKLGINNYTNLQQTVVDYNFNKSKSLEKLIIVTNDYLESPDEKLFYLVMGYINGKYKTLEFDSVDNDKFYDLASYTLKGIINIFDNSKDYILLLKGFYSNVDAPRVIMYKVDSFNFKKITK